MRRLPFLPRTPTPFTLISSEFPAFFLHRYSDKALFRKNNLQAVKEELGPESTKADWKTELDNRWAATPPEEKALWEARAVEDQKRYDREQAAYEAQVQDNDGDGGDSAASRKRSKKPDGASSTVIPQKKARP